MHNRNMALIMTTNYVEDSIGVFRQYKKLAERAMEQVKDEELFAEIDGENNSIAIIVKHMAGNMRSRFRDFLTTDGEKPDRNRDSEFVDPPKTREALMKMWEEGWSEVFGAIEALSESDCARTVKIRGEAHSVMQAIHRQIAHYAYHCGQIVMLAKHLRSESWKPLTIPRGKSEEYFQRVMAGEVSQR